MIHLKINPLSVNKCWQGRRYKTNDYKKYEIGLSKILDDMSVPKNEPLQLRIIFGFSSKLSDTDNPIKPFVDILQKKYDFNDRNIFKLIVDKIIVKKGNEFILFDIKCYTPISYNEIKDYLID